MRDFDNMNRPQLIEHLMQQGFVRALLERIPTTQMVKWAKEGRTYRNNQTSRPNIGGTQGQGTQPGQGESQGEGEDSGQGTSQGEGQGQGQGSQGEAEGQGQSQAQSKPQGGSQGQQAGQQGQSQQGEGQQGKQGQSQSQNQPPSPTLEDLERRIMPKVDARDKAMAEKLQQAIKDAVEKAQANQPRETTIKVKPAQTAGDDGTGEDTRINLGHVHKALPEILKWHLVEGENGRKYHVYAYGDRGAGKTTLAKQVNDARAKVLGKTLPFFMMSFHKTTQPHDLLGYMTPDISTGGSKYVTTSFRLWCERGGTMLFDEFDSAGMLAGAINAALANGYAVFPDCPEAPLQLHETCRAIAVGNTIGKGATIDYTGRERLDAATLDRFVFVSVDYDENLERHLAGSHGADWCAHIQTIRATIRKMGASAPDLCPGTRAILAGADMLSIDPTMKWADLENYLVWQGTDPDTITKVRALLPKAPPKMKV